MTQKILTPDGYKLIATVYPGDAVVAYDPDTGALQHNIIEKVEWISKHDYQECNAPQGYNDGEEPPTIKPEHIPFDFYVINNNLTLFQDQSVWYERDGHVNVYHAKDIAVGDTLFSDYDLPITVATVERTDGDGWWRFAISGDHSYVVDGLTLHNASRFWVGGGSANTWAAITNTNWAATSGGALNATVPGASDNVVFDSASGSSNSVLGANITIQNMDCASGTGDYAGTLTHNSTVTLTCNTGGTFRFSAGMTYTPANSLSIVTFTHTSGTMTLTCNGKNFITLTINGAGGTTTLADTLLCTGNSNGSFTLTAGTLDAGTNTAAITAGAFNTNNNNTRAWTQGGTLTVGGNAASGTTIINVGGTGLTFTKNSANWVIAAPTAGGSTLYWAWSVSNLTFNNLTINGGGSPTKYTISGFGGPNGLTFANLSVAAGVELLFGNSNFLTISNAVNISGTPLSPVLFSRGPDGRTFTFSCPSGTCAFNWCGFSGFTATGGATFTAKNSLDFTNNTGITITPPGMGPTTEAIPQRAFKAGATSQSVDVFIQDSSSLAGAGLTGLVYNASGLTAYYRKGQTGTATSITLATQTVGGVYSAGGLVQIDSTNTPGMYRFDIPDTVIASAGGATVYFQGAANMVPCIVALEIVAYDPTSADLAIPTETGYTLQQAMRVMMAVLCAKVSGLPGSPVFRDVNDTANRVTATTDASGNRTVVTLNP